MCIPVNAEQAIEIIIANFVDDYIGYSKDFDPNRKIRPILRQAIAAELQRLNEGNGSIIELHSNGQIYPESVISWMVDKDINRELCLSYPPVEREETAEVKQLKEKISELTAKLEQAQNERQFKFMTKDLEIMAKVQRDNWKSGDEDLKLDPIKLDIAKIINPKAKKSNAKSDFMGSAISPN